MTSTTQQEPVPDFGEPWKKRDAYHLCPYETRNGEIVADYEHRSLICVNACQGMADPTAEIQAMREAVSWLPKLIGHGHTDDCLFLNRANAPCDCGIDEAESILAKLLPFIK